LKDDSKIHFLVVGEGPEKAIGLEKIKGQTNYTVLPSVPKSKVPQLLSQCNLVLNPWLNSSLYEYGISPNKWIDYMWAGKPILVSFNGYQRIITDANCGKVVPAENLDEFVRAIIDFSAMSEFDLKSIGERGREYLLLNLTYEKHSKKLDVLFSESIEPI
jgi:glycosyltransferase involved in cell wall biosynthesis